MNGSAREEEEEHLLKSKHHQKFWVVAGAEEEEADGMDQILATISAHKYLNLFQSCTTDVHIITIHPIFFLFI